MRALLLAVMLLFPSVGYAQTRWVKIQEFQGQRFSIDTARVERLRSGYLSIWLRIDYDKPQLVNAEPVAYNQTQYWIDCAQKRLAAMGGTVYSAAGRAIDSQQMDGPRWQAIVPQTILALIAHAYCPKQ